MFDDKDPLHMMLLDIVLDPAVERNEHAFAAKVRWRLINEARDLIVDSGGVPRDVLNQHCGQLAGIKRGADQAAADRAREAGADI